MPPLIYPGETAAVRRERRIGNVFAAFTPPEIQGHQPGAAPLSGPMPPAAPTGRRRKLDVESVRQALVETGGNKVQAARLLGVGRATLYRFLKENPLD